MKVERAKVTAHRKWLLYNCYYFEGMLLFGLWGFFAFLVDFVCLFICFLFCFVLVLFFVLSNCCELEDKGAFLMFLEFFLE